MVDTLPPHTPYPRWEVTGTATEGYITINVMQSGNIDVKQGNHFYFHAQTSMHSRDVYRPLVDRLSSGKGGGGLFKY